MPSTNMGYWDMCQRIRITTITTTMTGAHRATKVGLHNAIWNAHYTVYHGPRLNCPQQTWQTYTVSQKKNVPSLKRY